MSKEVASAACADTAFDASAAENPKASKAAIDADLQKMFMYESETAIGVRAYCQKAIRAEFSIDFTKFDKNSGGLIWDGKWGDFTPDRDGTKID